MIIVIHEKANDLLMFIKYAGGKIVQKVDHTRMLQGMCNFLLHSTDKKTEVQRI